ncbi:hypothetical protein PV342_12935 [Streptomyces sp. PA03-3a]|nr:hypothetical protein [Streptomyces sp. PA03-3a]
MSISRVARVGAAAVLTVVALILAGSLQSEPGAARTEDTTWAVRAGDTTWAVPVQAADIVVDAHDGSLRVKTANDTTW